MHLKKPKRSRQKSLNEACGDMLRTALILAAQKGVRLIRANELFSESGDYSSSPIVIIRKPE